MASKEIRRCLTKRSLILNLWLMYQNGKLNITANFTKSVRDPAEAKEWLSVGVLTMKDELMETLKSVYGLALEDDV